MKSRTLFKSRLIRELSANDPICWTEKARKEGLPFMPLRQICFILLEPYRKGIGTEIALGAFTNSNIFQNFERRQPRIDFPVYLERKKEFSTIGLSRMQFLNNLTLPSSSTCQDSLERRRGLVRKRNRNDRRIYFGR
ncbi:hypothetical protein CDAR_224441 [Caerostris darwini]|uniref:Uncharacterized protein n=1 Tax=Caerostris darwini TaxID=1538125 RepID=A0AAV4WZ30_9ARAC|nr:hypothetical protein CDAR_224441 [Caerostris darwini]